MFTSKLRKKIKITNKGLVFIYLGIDTSNYTTSVSVIDGDNIYNERKILDVKAGECGIRQSDAVFIHLKTLPDLYKRISQYADMKKISAVGVSIRPRNLPDSYMPVFTVGTSFAKVIADTLNVPLYEYSHQDGHIMSGIHSCGCKDFLNEPFLSIHLSGGTTEILKCRYNGFSFEQEIIGGTSDISAGQFIDRSGVAMGLKFPCGVMLEKMALSADQKYTLPSSVKNTMMSFSGVETKVQGLVNNIDNARLALGIFSCISKSLTKAINNAAAAVNINKVLVVGGVASNSIIHTYLLENVKAKVYFASKELSTDNAVGIGLLTKMHTEEKSR